MTWPVFFGIIAGVAVLMWFVLFLSIALSSAETDDLP